MKKGLFILVLSVFSLASFAQQGVSISNDIELTEAKEVEKLEARKVLKSAKLKAKVIELNRKKSNEIISIKAYRKSLQIRVKTIKLC